MRTPPSLADEPWLKAPALRRVFSVVEGGGGVVRVNGGAVRNALMGEPVADIDLSTTLSPEQVTRLCEAAGLGVHPTGIAHGTVTVVSERQPFEVTTLRVDRETYGRRAKVEVTDDWLADAHRRDFTVNALYCTPSGEILDLVDGYADILLRKIRFVGSASKRIAEDYLRILRFFRFQARYGKGAPDAAGLAACTRLRRGLGILPAERIRQEFFKLLVAPRAAATLEIMRDARILAAVVPDEPDIAGLRRMGKIDIAQSLAPDAVLRLAALVERPMDHRDRLRLTNLEMARLEALAVAMPPSPALREAERRRILYRLGMKTWPDAVRLAWARTRARPDDAEWSDLLNLPATWTPPAFPLDGKMLVAQGLEPGRRIGRILSHLEDWWVASDFKPGREALLARIDTVP